MYEYTAVVVEVIDGDTCRLNVDHGMSIWSKQVFRLKGINAPEKVGVADPKPGVAAKEYLCGLIEGKLVVVRTFRDAKKKYGRYLAELYLPGDPVSVNQRLIDAGYAVPYEGGARG